MDGIRDKVVAITGAGSGMGEAAARRLAAQGARVVLGGRRAERLEAVAAETGGAALPVDVTRAAEVEAFVGAAVERHGRLDVLVSGAGAASVGPLADQSAADWDAMIDVNLRGVLHGIAAALPVFARQGGGQLVHVASTAAHRIAPGQAVYAATKTAVRVLTEGLRQEAGDAFRVTLISPGMTRTPFIDGSGDEELRAYAQRVAMPPEAVAEAIAYAIAQPDAVEVGEIIIRPTAQR